MTRKGKLHSINTGRRRLIRGVAAGAGLASIAYITNRGIRFPRLTLSPPEPASSLETALARFEIDGAIFTNNGTSNGTDDGTDEAITKLRAIQPEPSINLFAESGEVKFSIGNIAASAALDIKSATQADITESSSGLNRHVTIKLAKRESIELAWRFDDQRKVNFAVIGDSGGGDELPWCLSKAAELGAEFLLHLGDFNYTRGEYDLAVAAFGSAAIPSYITIGNHDFNDAGLVYEHFLTKLGPFNTRFELAGTEFLNIDTSVDFFPLKSGQRGRFIASLEENEKPKIAFSHRPFVDIRPGEDHEMASEAEEQWLHDTFARINCDDYLCGHVHKSGETDVRGLRQWTVGEGLGYEDWVARKPISQMLMGSVEPESAPQFAWVMLDMPWELHTSPKHLEKLIKEQPQDAINWFNRKRAEIAAQAPKA